MTEIKLLEDGIISTIKSIAKDDKINADFVLENINFNSTNQDFFSSKQISLPKINNGAPKRIGLIRGIADLVAFYHLFHDNKIHHRQFSDDDASRLYDNLEKFRIIAKACESYRGSGSNLIKLVENNLDELDPVSGFLPLFLLENLSIKSKKIEQFLNVYKKFLTPEIADKLKQLQALKEDQEKFSLASLELIELFRNKEKESKNKEKEASTKSEEIDKNDQETTSNEENIEAKEEVAAEAEIASEGEVSSGQKSFDFIKNELPASGNSEAISNSSSKEKIKFIPEYKIFTDKFDQIIKAENLATAAELQNLREQLDAKLKKLNNISNKLTAKLKRKLLAKKEVTFEQNKEEGIIDRKKISQIITQPFSGNNYVVIKEHNYQDTIVTLLLDNSGSMRGQPIVMTAMASEIIAKILEKFGIKTEILGFTTVDWRGGKARKLWESSGKPENPGRISDLRHIIYKNANQSFKKAKSNLALMLKEGILKENIDGEAIIWAKKRLDNRTEQRKILMIISDGTPVDDSTNSNNYPNILSDHLHHIIGKIEKHTNIELTAIGIGHEVGDFYKNSVMISHVEELGDVMIDRICKLL